MFSYIRRFIFTILVAQWMYAEAILLAPESQPVLDTLTQFLRPPTHDKWVETYQALQERREAFSARVGSVGELKDELTASVSRFAQHDGLPSLR